MNRRNLLKHGTTAMVAAGALGVPAILRVQNFIKIGLLTAQRLSWASWMPMRFSARVQLRVHQRCALGSSTAGPWRRQPAPKPDRMKAGSKTRSAIT
jgi:hypothetical protein